MTRAPFDDRTTRRDILSDALMASATLAILALIGWAVGYFNPLIPAALLGLVSALCVVAVAVEVVQEPQE